MLVRLRICTIPLAFRRVSVCVCLVGFASLQSLWAHTFKASLPCLPLPLHQILTFPQPLQKDNNPLPRTMFLPPLSKVRCCHPKKFGRLPEGLLPIRTINEIFRTIPSTKLASLVKGELLLTEKFGRLPEGLLPIRTINEIFRTIPSTKLASLVKGERLLTEKFGRLPEGLLYHPSPRTITLAFRRVRVCVCLYGFVFALSHPLFVG